MKDITNQLKYLEGLIEGKELESKSEEGKILAELTKSVSDLSKKVDDLQRLVEKVNDFIFAFLDEMEALDNALNLPFSDSEEDDDLYEVTCENCGHEYYADFEEFMSDDVVCPKCGKKYNLSEDIFHKLLEGDHNHD